LAIAESAGPELSTEPLLRVRELRKSFGGVEVLHGVSVSATEGRVLALLGENGAGKSTLVKIISGDYRPDSGSISLGGETHDQLSPISARSLGVRMIYQELNDAAALTVAENVLLGRLPRKAGFVRWREVRATAQAVLDELGVDIEPDARMSSLHVGERQVVEIARALSDEARVLILDEPTAALSNDETIRLFEFINRLRARNTAMIYITHRLDEVRRIADDVVILRDGNLVLEAKAGDCSRAELVEAMVGASVDDVGRPDRPLPPSTKAPRLVLRAATSGRAFANVNLDVWPGEVVGLYGKVGSGIVEVAEAVFGLRPLTSGSVHVSHRPAPANPRQAVARGIGFLPADRQREGAFMPLSCARNLAAPTWRRQAVGRVWLNGRSEMEVFERWRTALSIRVAPGGANRPIVTLSGGNQQKVMLARWLQAKSELLVLVEPTRGVDVGARQEIYATVRALAQTGVAILVASSDYEEIVQLADRAAVMSRGELVRHLNYESITMRTLTDSAGG
jgi:ribose transport system ATP-binding protein